MRKAIYLGWMICFALGVSGQTAPAPALSRMIPVPTLAEVRSGEIAYDLSASDFSIKDEGVEQQVQLGDSDAQSQSLMVIIQTGRNAAGQLSKVEHLDDLLDTILTGPADQVGILTFDSRPHILKGLGDSAAVSRTLASIAPGDSGAALFDALHEAARMLEKAPEANRRVILLISGEHDHSSMQASAANLIRSISLANVSVYGLTFTAPRKDLLGRLWSINPLAMTASAMEKNAVGALAQLTGGDFYYFDSEKSFEDHVGQIANHIHNSYWLTFQPQNPSPGFHSLQVAVRRSKTSIVAARSGYWISADNEPKDEARPQ